MKSITYKKFTFGAVLKRHWQTSWPYLNFSKLANIGWSKINEYRGQKIINSQPYFIKIEPTSKCNLRCPGCLHAAENLNSGSSLRLGDMDQAVFKKIIDELEKYLIKVSLYAEGEPLIYPRIADMVAYLSEKNIGSVISSNLNYLTPALAHDLVKNKLTHLIVCLDGCDDESYKKYRQGGNFAKVIGNIELIQTEKARQKSKLPCLEIQTIRLKHLSDFDLERIKKLAETLGADYFLIKEDLSQFYNQPHLQKKRCFWLYASPQFKWNGTVQPCCYYYSDKDNDFGDINKSKFNQIWNNEKYQQARSYFRSGQAGNINMRCNSCDFFRK